MPNPAPPQRPPSSMHPQTAIAMGNLLQRLAGNPKTRTRTLEMVKEIDPSYRLPADVAIESFKAEQKAERDKERSENAKAQREARYKKQRSALVGTHGEDVVKQIEETTLKKYPHLELEDAAKLYASEDTAAAPIRDRQPQARHGQHWEFPSIPGLLENPHKAATDMAYSVIDELRGRMHA